MTERDPRPEGQDEARVDFRAALDRIRTAAAWWEGGAQLTPAQEQALLEGRANDLARELKGAEAPAYALAIVEFSMAHERYGLEAAMVREVHPLRQLTPLPGTPEFVLGIVHIRGRVLSLVDLKKFFSLPEKGLAETNQIIVLRSEAMEFGILADSILGVRAVNPDDLERNFPTLSGLRKDFLLGVLPGGTAVLDARRILSDPGIVVRGGDYDSTNYEGM